ncbi:hypothetical protein K2X40_04960 [Candidatus Babeliales bacterium]|nr:hypothetical protein [Candidatus Babeliales bacterium]
MFSKLCRVLWGDISREEFKKFGLLSGVFFFMIGAYWMVRLIKNASFMHLVGPQNLPYAKMVSLVSLLVLVLFYNKLVDWFEKTNLIYLITIFYGTLFLSFSYLLTLSSVGSSTLPLWANEALGWIFYVATESYGSLVIALFWSFVASAMDPASGKRGYPVIVSGAQCGSLLGAFLMATQSTALGVPLLTCIAAISVLMIPLMIKLFTVHHAKAFVAAGDKEKKKPTGVIEGLKLICTKPYLMGILVVSTVYETVTWLFEFHMNSSAHATFGSIEKVTSFLGIYGVATNMVSLLFALLGTSFFIRRFGITFCLVAYPAMLALFVCYTWSFPGMWAFLAAVVAAKGFSYALNNPCKEMMYIPTSKDIKFKAKSWIDVQGSRSAKASGATIAAMFPAIPALLTYGSMISLAIIAVWIPIALFVGRTNNTLIQSGQTIE